MNKKVQVIGHFVLIMVVGGIVFEVLAKCGIRVPYWIMLVSGAAYAALYRLPEKFWEGD